MKIDRVLAGFLLLVALGAAPGLAQSPARADRPEVKVGDTWVYRNTDVFTGEKREISFSVTAVDPARIVTESGISTSGAWTFTRDWNPVERKAGDVVANSLKPYWPFLQFPLEVGKSWETAFENEVTVPSGLRHAKWQWKARVVAAEAVTVPAGTFQTLKVEANGTFASREGLRSWTGSHKDTVWYAPDVKRVVKRDFEQSAPANNFQEHHVVELLSFKLAP